MRKLSASNLVAFINQLDKNQVYNYVSPKTKGVIKIDFLFIDGWHTINQVKRDWEFTKFLSANGIVGFHDTSCHPGPKRFLEALDTEKWNVIPNTCPADWGIGFVWAK